MDRQINVNFSDAKVAVWLEHVDEVFLKAVMLSVCAMMRTKGWDIRVPYGEDFRPNFSNKKWERQWDEKIRKGSKDNLEFVTDISGRCLEFKFWEDVIDHSKDNASGGRYIFDKELKMPYLLKMITLLTKKQILEHLEKHYNIKRGKGVKPFFKTVTAYEIVQESIKDCGHFKPELGHAEITCDNDKSADGFRIEHGSQVYVEDHGGRLVKGIAYYNLNSQWWVVTGKYDKLCQSNYKIYINKPDGLRIKRNERKRRAILESKMAEAIKALDFQRAQLFKDLIFGVEPLFHIKKGALYFRSNYSGYTDNQIDAGRYTEQETKSYSNHSNVSIVPIYQ